MNLETQLAYKIYQAWKATQEERVLQNAPESAISEGGRELVLMVNVGLLAGIWCWMTDNCVFCSYRRKVGAMPAGF